jgi:hypothetical protein
MRKSTLRRNVIRWALVVAGVAALIPLGLELTEQERSEEAAATGAPATIKPLAGTSLSHVTLSASAAARLGLKVAPVRKRIVAVGSRRVQRKVVPYSAVLYDEQGKTWVYTRAKRLTFVRAPITVDLIRGDAAVLSAGPRPGTLVATVGAAELYGAEFEVDH